MTVDGRDASDYDTSVSYAGLGFFTHKVTEGISVVHQEYGPRLNGARVGGVPVLGSYHVLRTPSAADGSLQAQLDYWVAHMDAATPWWRSWPHWILQVDAERWVYDNVPAADVLAFAALLASSGLPGYKITYASRGQYGDGLAGIATDLWNADYRGSSGGSYPGDGWTTAGSQPAGWAPYSGQVPKLLQYTSTPYDKDAFRGSLDDLLNLTGGIAMGSEWAATPNTNQPWALTQGSSGYAGQQRDTALAFAWEHAYDASQGVKQILANQAAAPAGGGLTDADRALMQAVIDSNTALKASVDALDHRLATP